jgi:NAD(P)-dependent dehydrogenase (short-subunit alcohol dehydrogenase family)
VYSAEIPEDAVIIAGLASFRGKDIAMADMDGKIVLITGATNGIGKVAALEIAKKGATLVIVGRNPAKTAETVAQIKAESGNTKVDSIIADLSSMAEVRKVADAFKAKHNRLDVLINNAGAIFAEREETVDGYETTFAFNHLAYFLLTNLLLDTLKASAPARIINVASDAHTAGTIKFDDLNMKNGYGLGGMRAYSMSKLANIMFTYELARRLEGTGVTANVLHPGFVNTGFGKNQAGLMRFVMNFVSRLGISPEQGADTIVYLASSPQAIGESGKYWEKRKAVSSSAVSYNEADQKRLWDVSEQMTGIAQPVAV